MNNFLGRVAEIAMMGDYPFLHWIIFDTIGLMCLKILTEILILDVYFFIKHSHARTFRNFVFVIFILIFFFVLFYILFRLCIYKSNGFLLYVAIFSLIFTAYIFLKTIYASIKTLPKSNDNLQNKKRPKQKRSKPKINNANETKNNPRVKDIILKISKYKKENNASVKSENNIDAINIKDNILTRWAPEYVGGKISESSFLISAEQWLGDGYVSLPNGRYISKDGMRQVRYGKHETNSKIHHAHFESYDKPIEKGGRIIENTSVEIIQDVK